MTPPIMLGLNICERVIVEEGTRHITLVNCLRHLFFEQFPAEESIAVYGVLTSGMGESTLNLVVNFLNDMEEVFSQSTRLHFPDRTSEVAVYFHFHRFEFPIAGSYQFSLFVDSEIIAQRVVNVLEAPGE